MSEERKKITKKYFFNTKIIIFILLLFITIYLSTKESKLFLALGVLLLISIIYVVSYISELKIIKNIYLYKNKTKTFSYKPYTISKEKLIEEIKNYGIPLTFIEIDKKIYAIEVGKNKEKYLCYLDNNEFYSLEEFLNYKIDNTSLNEQNKIKILSYNYQDPAILKEH